jgi:hypothetical protein
MRTHMVSVTALAGSMLLGPSMLGPSQAGSAPDFKNVVGATHARAVSAGMSAGGRVGAQASARPASRHYAPSDRGEPAWQGHEDQPYNRQFAHGAYYGYPWERYSLE